MGNPRGPEFRADTILPGMRIHVNGRWWIVREIRIPHAINGRANGEGVRFIEAKDARRYTFTGWHFRADEMVTVHQDCVSQPLPVGEWGEAKKIPAGDLAQGDRIMVNGEMWIVHRASYMSDGSGMLAIVGTLAKRKDAWHLRPSDFVLAQRAIRRGVPHA